MRRKSLILIVAILMGAMSVVRWTASAHNVDLKKARELVRDYARKVRDESGGRYLHYSTNCVAAFPGHNHIARCVIDYQNEEDTKKDVYTCRELIELKMMAHNRGWGYQLFAYHVHGQCGSTRFNGQMLAN